jgi:hypothetical protein
MDTMTYASVAILPWSIAHEYTQHAPPDVEFVELDLSKFRQ